jgi:hypothetical protein
MLACSGEPAEVRDNPGRVQGNHNWLLGWRADIDSTWGNGSYGSFRIAVCWYAATGFTGGDDLRRDSGGIGFAAISRPSLTDLPVCRKDIGSVPLLSLACADQLMQWI